MEFKIYRSIAILRCHRFDKLPLQSILVLLIFETVTLHKKVIYLLGDKDGSDIENRYIPSRTKDL
jgi:hypothetical protein